MKKIWITGAEGHIGTALLELLEGVEYQLLPTDIHEVDITKIDEVTQFVYVNRPDVIKMCIRDRSCSADAVVIIS